MVASDKLFFWLFQSRPDRILQLLDDLPADAGGYRFTAPALKAREHRLDGLFLPPVERPTLPALILEAQMAADPGFLRRLYAESARLLQQEASILHWRVVVLCPSRQLNFGDPTPLWEFLQERVCWIELAPSAADPIQGTADETSPSRAPGSTLRQILGLLLQPQEQIPERCAAIRRQARDRDQAAEIEDLIAAILLARFNTRPIPELCAMGGITLEDFTQSVAYREIHGHGLQEGRQEGRRQEAIALVCRLLVRRCGPLGERQRQRLADLPLESLEALSEALLEFRTLADLETWLASHRPEG